MNLQPIKEINKGIYEVYGNIFDDIGLNDLVKSNSNYAEVFKDIVMGKLLCLGSKRKIAEQIEDKFNKIIPLNSIYRTMDKINDKIIEEIQQKITKYNSDLLQGRINILFYDATTIYFESFSDDELRQLGYSKDLKFNQPQIIFTMLLSEQGLPLGYQIFPGNTYEGHTLQEALLKWQELYPNKKITLVADSGMLNELNLRCLEDSGFDYIVCARLKNYKKAIKEQILTIKDNITGDCYQEINLDNRRLIISYKENRAIKDEYDRNKNIEKLQKKLSTNKAPDTLINNYGYKKFISINGNAEIELNEEKIQEAKRWDGLHGLITNIKTMSTSEIYSHYRELWKIEDAFRLNKTDLKIRPIFHWTPNRIKAHIAISYIAFCCYKIVKFKVDQNSTLKLSYRTIREALESVRFAIYEDSNNGVKFKIPLPMQAIAKIIYASQGLSLEMAVHAA